MEKKEAMKILKDFYDKSALFSIRTALDTVIPELKESEGERIRKALIKYLDALDDDEIRYGVSFKDMRTWLEKQSKASKVEQAMREVEEKVEAFTEAHKGETSEEILAQVRGEQKPVWSEEDDKMFNNIASHLNATCGGFPEDEKWANNFLDWLKSLKGRIVPQSKQVWSEEDDSKLKEVLYYIEYVNKTNVTFQQRDLVHLINWLKSLRPQSTWKPCEGQLECLGYAIEKAEKDWSPLTNNRIYLTLKALKEQLLELRGSKV